MARVDMIPFCRACGWIMDSPLATVVDDMEPPANDKDVATGIFLAALSPNDMEFPPSNDIFSILTLESTECRSM